MYIPEPEQGKTVSSRKKKRGSTAILLGIRAELTRESKTVEGEIDAR